MLDTFHSMSAPAMTPISIRLEELRNAKGWSQAELARRSGVPQSTISRIEAGKTNSIELSNLERLASALGVNAAVLIEHTPAPRPEKGRGRG
jgi:transcriptional regulator with XRE-family HTH domain